MANTWQSKDNQFITQGKKVFIASNTVTSTGNTSATPLTDVGKGVFYIKFGVTALTFGTGIDMIRFVVKANSKAVTGTWNTIGEFSVGDAGGIGAAEGVGTFDIPVINHGDNSICLYYFVLGSTTSCTFSADIYPVLS